MEDQNFKEGTEESAEYKAFDFVFWIQLCSKIRCHKVGSVGREAPIENEDKKKRNQIFYY